MTDIERIKKAIEFFRFYSSRSNEDVYRESVLKFCTLVENQYLPARAEFEREIEQAFF